MIATKSLAKLGCIILSCVIFGSAYAALTDISSVPLNTYTGASAVDVKPNVMFILDDSGSMGWDYLPDWANDNNPPIYYFKNSAFNGVAYNPALRYLPPITYTSAGALDTAKYPSMSGVSAATGGDGSATSTSPNWSAVPDDGFGIQSTGTSNLVNDAYSYTSIAGEYCTADNLRTCTTSTTPSTAYSFPAIVRWCNSTALSTCKATNDGATYNKVRMAIPRAATITVSGSASTSVSGITVSGVQIMSGTAAASTTPSTLASRIADQINLCSKAIPASSNCGIVGYTAIVPQISGNPGNVITIYAPATISATPAVTSTGGMTLTTTAFTAGSVPGENTRVTITSTVNSYAKGANRTDCAGATCTYVEEMTNYANWWAYSHTRMQMMKTAASYAFSKLDVPADIAANVSRYRVGFLTLNNNQTDDFLNLDEFKTQQKYDWYRKFLRAKPNNSTPLRESLADAGRIYAGKKNGSTYNGVVVKDPLQYSCQPNYTILSTDGFWNGNAGFKLDGSTAVGNQDAALPRPLADGASYTIQARTATLQGRSVQWQKSTKSLQKQISQLHRSTSNLQQQTSQLQKSTSQLQTRTSDDSGTTWTAWSNTTSSCTPDTSGPTRRECQYTAWSAYTNASLCTASPQDTSGTWSTSTSGVATQCQTVVSSPYANVSSCTATTTPNGSGQTTQCQYTPWVDVSVSTCTGAVAQDTTNPYNMTATSGVASKCSTAVSSAYADTAPPCTVTTTPDASGQTTQCQYATSWSAYADTPSCTAVASGSTSSPYTVPALVQCQNSYGSWTNVDSCAITADNECQYTPTVSPYWTAWTNVGACTPAPKSPSSPYTVANAKECQVTGTSGGTSDTLADVAAYYYGTDLRSNIVANGTGTCVGVAPAVPPATGTITTDLCDDDVKAFGRDVATTQHMTTFTLGLGAQGEMVFNKDYWNSTSGDFYDVSKGTTASPSTGICAWQTSGSCNWPVPASDSLNNIDDLWHAGVNGRGTYFSASDQSTLSEGISGALKNITNTPKPGTAAAAASSNPNISSSDNYVFSSSYKSVDWYGELIRQQLNASNGTGQLTSPQWSSMTLLDCATTAWKASTSYTIGQVYSHAGNCYKVAVSYASGATYDVAVDTANTARVVKSTTVNNVTTTTDVVPLASRTIYTKGSSGLVSFEWANLSGTQQAYFSGSTLTYASPVAGLSQFCTGGGCLTALQQTNTTAASGGAAGENLVNFLRGQRSNEGTMYRSRTHVLGDIISSEGRYVKKPLYNYSDANFIDFRDSSAIASRQGMVYVAANDGMLHAFNSDNGQEEWAYIPELVLPNIYKLADKDYANKHQYFVDGTPEVGEICPNAPGSSCSDTQWKSILVGGLNYGGKGFYALDITNPASPQLLWEISNATAGFANLGYSYSNPRITKLKTGQWVVIFASGYNNADGKGHIYVVNANTGALITDINNNVAAGSAANPSGLARISAHAPNSDTDNTTVAVYGGDLFGNLWRFDINNDIPPSGYEAQLLVNLQDPSNVSQAITTKPTVTTVNAVVGTVTTPYTVVYVGTGRYLGVTDVSPPSTQIQTFYGIKDDLSAGVSPTTAIYGNPHTLATNFVKQTLTGYTAGAVVTCPTSAPAAICAQGQVVRTLTNNTLDWGVKNGWYIDLWPLVQANTKPEMSISDSSLGVGTLVFTTIALQGGTSGDACKASGTVISYSCAVDYLTGGAIPGSFNVGCTSLGVGVATRPVMIELSDGTIIELIRSSGGSDDALVEQGGGTTTGGDDMGDTKIVTPPPPTTFAGGTRRVSWRKLQM